MVIGAAALFKLANVLCQQAHQDVCNVINNLAGLELLVATVIVSYVSIRYLWFYFSPRHP